MLIYHRFHADADVHLNGSLMDLFYDGDYPFTAGSGIITLFNSSAAFRVGSNFSRSIGFVSKLAVAVLIFEVFCEKALKLQTVINKKAKIMFFIYISSEFR